LSYVQLGLYSNSPAIHSSKGIESADSAEKRARMALNFLKRAHYLNHVIGGIENPENISTYSQLGGAYQDFDEREDAMFCWTKALALSERLYGQKHVQTALLCHQIAIAHRIAGNFKQAIEYESKNYELCKELLGENHLQTMEANIWLTSITRDAVQDARATAKKPKKKDYRLILMLLLYYQNTKFPEQPVHQPRCHLLMHWMTFLFKTYSNLYKIQLSKV